jgi:hypothetical protein
MKFIKTRFICVPSYGLVHSPPVNQTKPSQYWEIRGNKMLWFLLIFYPRDKEMNWGKFFNEVDFSGSFPPCSGKPTS